MILYVSNFLSQKGSVPQPCEFIVSRLRDMYDIKGVSSRKNYLSRLLSIFFSVLFPGKKLQLIVIDVYAFKSFFIAWWVSRLSLLLNIPYITFLHSHHLLKRFEKKDRKLNRLLAGSVRNICPSPFLASYCPLEPPAEVIPNPIDISRYPFIARSENKELNILWLRSVYHKYNPELAIEMAAELVPLFPTLKLNMVGPLHQPTYERCLSLAARLGISDKVQFHGLLSKNEWITLAGQQTIFLNTTNWDNAPVSLVEAAALGLPIVSTNVGGIPQLFHHGHDILLAPPSDARALCNQIIRLMSDRELFKSIATHARTKALEHDWETACLPRWKDLLQPYSGTAA